MKWIFRLFWAGIASLLLGILGIAAVYFYVAPDLPSIEKIREIRLQVPLRIYSSDGLLVQEYGEKRRVPLSYSELPERLIQAFLAAEDDRFFEHHGVDYEGLAAAVLELVTTGSAGRGGSTITMQLARNLFLTLERTYERKIKEIFLSLQIETELSKEEILELYLNKIFLGHRSYGVGAAAQVYYGVDVDQLTLAQMAMIAGLPKSPSLKNPVSNPTAALDRRNYVLGRMRKLGFISQDEFTEAKAQPVTAGIHSSDIQAPMPYVGELVRAELVQRFGEEETYTGGYQVTLSVDSRLQSTGVAALRQALRDYDRRHGWRGVENHFDQDPAGDNATLSQWQAQLARVPNVGDLQPAVVLHTEDRSFNALLRNGEAVSVDWDGIKWARPFISRDARGAAPARVANLLKAGDLVRLLELETVTEVKDDQGETRKQVAYHWELSQVPDVAGALVALDTSNGAIRALVGGYDFYLSKFNRATQALRQPGSGFKAIIYSSAIRQGYNPASLINDAPVVFDDVSLEGKWRPENYSGKFFGPTRLRVALKKSRNLVSIRLLRAMGIDTVLEHAQRFGFDPNELPANLSLSLGSGVVTPIQMSRAYAVLANGGYRIEPWLIQHIKSSEGELIYQADPVRVCPECPITADGDNQLPPYTRAAPRVITAQNHYLMNSMMRDVITSGTATKARVLGRNDLAGKTGTTNDQRDAWFNGFHPSLVANVWVGFDNNDKLGRGEVGGRAALPAWIDFMRVALDGVPEAPLRMPPGLVRVLIDPTTGTRAQPGQPNAIFEVFPADQVPDQTVETVVLEPVSPEAGTAEQGEEGNPSIATPPVGLDIF